MLYSHPQARSFVADALVTRIRALHIEPDVIAGTATAAIGWAALVADRLKLPFVYVRAKAKEHGAKKRIEGDLPEGKDVVLVEDLLSTGGSAMSSVEALRDEGKATVTDVVAICSYEMEASLEGAQQQRVKLHPLCPFSLLIDVAVEMGKISNDDASLARSFVKDPTGWQS